MLKITPKDVKRQANSAMVKELLSDRYRTFFVDRLVVRESRASETTDVECTLVVGGDSEHNISGAGLGVLDALFNAIVQHVVGDCSSLRNISVESFQVQTDKEDLREFRKNARSTAAAVETCLIIDNGFDTNSRLVPFRSKSRSVLAATVAVVTEAIEYFVNSEIAVLYLKELIDDSKKRNRFDLTETYISKLSDLMSNTSYEQI